MVSMRAVLGAAAVVGMTGCGPAVVVQGFGAVLAPTCTVEDSGPSLSRGVLDLGATDRYQAVLRPARRAMPTWAWWRPRSSSRCR